MNHSVITSKWKIMCFDSLGDREWHDITHFKGKKIKNKLNHAEAWDIMWTLAHEENYKYHNIPEELDSFKLVEIENKEKNGTR